MTRISGYEREERLDLFVNCAPIVKGFINAGIFLNGKTDYLMELAGVFQKMTKREDAFEIFKRLMEEAGFRSGAKALYSAEAVNSWVKPFSLFSGFGKVSFPRHSRGKKFLIKGTTPGNPSDYGKRAGMVLLRVKGFEDMEISKKNEWELRKVLLDLWMKVCSDDAVSNYLDRVKETVHLIEYVFPDIYYRYPFSKMFFYLLPIAFDRFFNVVMVSRASLYYRKDETRKELWNEIVKVLNDMEILDELMAGLEEKGMTIDDLKDLVNLALSQETLDMLMKSWRNFVRMALGGDPRLRDRITGVFLDVDGSGEEQGKWMEFGEYHVPDGNVELHLFYEEGTESLIDKLESNLRNLKYMGNLNVSIISKHPGSALLGGSNSLSILRGTGEGSNKPLKHLDSIRLLYTLFYFTARLANFQARITGNGKKFRGVMCLLNTDPESEHYEFWSEIRFLYEYFGLPFQTVTRRFLEGLFDPATREAAKKNMLISLFKHAKSLSFNFGGFNLPPEATIFAVIEKPSPLFFYIKGSEESLVGARRHSLLEIYSIHVKDGKASISIEDKFLILSGGYGETQAFEHFIERKANNSNTWFLFIGPVENSFLKVFYDRLAGSNIEFAGRAVNVGYKELRAITTTHRAGGDCLVIYTDGFVELAQRLGINIGRNTTVFAIKPVTPPGIETRFGSAGLYHTALQVFFMENTGGIVAEKVYSRRKDLIFFTLISLSMFESEAAQTPYSRLDIYSRSKSAYIRIRRRNGEDDPGREYIFPLRAILYEMLEFMRHLPGTESAAL